MLLSWGYGEGISPMRLLWPISKKKGYGLREGQRDLPDSALFSNSLSLKYAAYQCGIFWGNVSWTPSLPLALSMFCLPSSENPEPLLLACHCFSSQPLTIYHKFLDFGDEFALCYLSQPLPPVKVSVKVSVQQNTGLSKLHIDRNGPCLFPWGWNIFFFFEKMKIFLYFPQ